MKRRHKSQKKKKNQLSARLNLLFTFVFTLFALLILRLGIIQIVQGEEFKLQVEKTAVESVNYSVPRGVMYDRNYNKVVYNVPQKAITFTAPKNPQPNELLKIATDLAKYIEMTDLDKKKVTVRDKKDIWLLQHENGQGKVSKREEKKYSDKELYQLKLERITKKEIASVDDNIAAIYRKISSARALTPTIVKNKDVTDIEYALVSEHLGNLPGVDVTTDWERAYPYGNTLRGIIGSVRTGLPEEKVEYYTAKGYNLNDRVGYSYLEESLESVLQGIKSKVKTVTNKQGEVVETEVVSEGVSGNDVVLTIDMELQKAIEKALEEEILNGVRFPRTDHFNKAFVVAMNPKTGEVLALAGKQYDRESKTFFDYGHGTFTAAFEPGSIVKGATILLGYNKGVISPGTVLRDEVMHLPGQKTLKSHVNMGNINDLKALERSSNVYMAKIVLAIGGETYQPNTPIGIDYLDLVKEMRNFYAQFGLGTKTGFVFSNEAIGIQRTPKNPGELLYFSFGQFDTYTPLQMAQYVATIANNGYRMKPYIVKEVRKPDEKGTQLGPIIESFHPQVLNKITASEKELNQIQKGFYLVVNGSQGTARSSFKSIPVTVAGKTGTAQSYAEGDATNTLTFVGYAPYENPEIAFSVVVPNAYIGKKSPFPYNPSIRLGERLLEAYFHLKNKRAPEVNKD